MAGLVGRRSTIVVIKCLVLLKVMVYLGVFYFKKKSVILFIYLLSKS